jgi:D-xylose transport system permease protein
MTAPVASTAPPPSAASGSLLSKLEIDVRMLGMLAALAIIWIGFDLLSGGVFLTPRNLWNLSVQTASVAIMATGMVLVIVTRNIDLSVGAILGVTGMIIGVAQVQWLPAYLGSTLADRTARRG